MLWKIHVSYINNISPAFTLTKYKLIFCKLINFFNLKFMVIGKMGQKRISCSHNAQFFKKICSRSSGLIGLLGFCGKS